MLREEMSVRVAWTPEKTVTSRQLLALQFSNADAGSDSDETAEAEDTLGLTATWHQITNLQDNTRLQQIFRALLHSVFTSTSSFVELAAAKLLQYSADSPWRRARFEPDCEPYDFLDEDLVLCAVVAGSEATFKMHDEASLSICAYAQSLLSADPAAPSLSQVRVCTI